MPALHERRGPRAVHVPQQDPHPPLLSSSGATAGSRGPRPPLVPEKWLFMHPAPVCRQEKWAPTAACPHARTSTVRTGDRVKVLGINAIFHDPAAALVVDGRDGRGRRGGAVQPPQARQAAGAVLRVGAARAGRALVPGGGRARTSPTSTRSPTPSTRRWPGRPSELGLDDPWDHLRQTYAERAPGFLATALPGLDPAAVRFVPHHVAHAASAGAGRRRTTTPRVLVLDGRGECGQPPRRPLRAGAGSRRSRAQELPHSLGPALRGASPSTSASCAAATSTR